MEVLKLEKPGSVLRSFRFDKLHSAPEKLMVIVDRDNLRLLDALISVKKPELQVMYILTDSPEVRSRYKYNSRVYPVRVNIRSLLRHDIVDEILWMNSSLPRTYLEEIKLICFQFGVSLLVPEQIDLPGLEVKIERYIGRHSFSVIETTPRKSKIFLLKTIWETLFASVALFLLSPALLSISIIIKLSSPGPVIFKQLRVGLRGRKFYIYKFRTMVADAELLKASLKTMNEADGPAFKMKNDPRITRIGKILRRTGFDEVPQLYNVVMGQMSLIGPRPLLPSEVSAQAEWQLKRLCIKPGITCTWQILPERNKVPFDRWMELDRDYVENWSIKHDIRIFFGTIRSFFAARGI